MALVAIEFRQMTADDYEQVGNVEARAFYNKPSPERDAITRDLIPPDWTVVAEVDGRIVAAVRTVPHVRRMHGAKMGFGAVGPVSCLAPYRRRGLVARLLVLAMEKMRERNQVLSGLHTPHDSLYRRFGWERGESKIAYSFGPKDVRLRFRSAGGHTDGVGAADWQRVDRLFQEKHRNANGPFLRGEQWWKYAVLGHFERDKFVDYDSVVWVDRDGADQGYVAYTNRNMAPAGQWIPQEVWIRDFVALTSDAYVGLWEHMLTHDLAEKISVEMHPADPFRHICDDPFNVQTREPDGAMIRVVDVEKAFEQRPYLGTRPASVVARISDRHLPWNDGAWRIEGAEGRTRAERTNAAPDVEMDANALAALFTGFLRPAVAVTTGFARLNRPEALPEMEQLFAVADAPFCPDYY
jgi:predicted acetyltransferase